MPQVIICADNAIARAGLAAMVTATALEVVAQVNSLVELQDWLRTQSADLLLLASPELTSTVCRELTQIVTDWRFETSLSVLLLIDWEESSLIGDRPHMDSREWPRYLAPLLATGCVSLLPLTVSTAQVQNAIATILSGFVVIHPEIAETISMLPSAFADETTAEAIALAEPLTPREIEVLNQLAGGLSNKAIANQLHISEHTVKFHISAILSKLDAASRTEAVAIGIRTGLVML